MIILSANNANTVISSSINAADTTITVADPTVFPSPVAGDSYFIMTIKDAATGQRTEIVNVTSISGNSLTVQRAQEGTTAQSWTSGDIVANLFTAGTFNTLAQIDADGNIDGNAMTASALAVSRTFRTNLASSTAANFNGTDDVSPGVTGILPFANGGLGANTVQSARQTLAIDQLPSAKADYLAVGDGVADDTAALNAAASSGKLVFLPPGIYKTTGPINLDNGSGIIGAGDGISIIRPANNVNAFVFPASSGCRVERLGITYSSASNTSGKGIVLPDFASGSVVRDVYMIAPETGISMGNCQATVVEHVQIWFFLNYGIRITGNFNDSWIDKVFLNGAAYGTNNPGATSVGIATSNKAHAIFLSNVEVIQCNQPLALIGSSPTNVETAAFSFFVNCFFDSSTSSCIVSNARNIFFIGCWFSNRDSGLSITSSVGIYFQACQFVNNDGHACIIQPGCSYIGFYNTLFDSNGQASSGSYSGIVSNATTWLMVNGCTFGNLGTFSATMQNGIILLNAVISNVNINDNVFSPTLLGVGLSNSSTGTNITASNNLGLATRNRGTTSMSSGTSVSVAHGLGVTPALSSIMLSLASGHAGITDYYVSTTSSTTFTISTNTAPASTITFAWLIDMSKLQ